MKCNNKHLLIFIIFFTSFKLFGQENKPNYSTCLLYVIHNEEILEEVKELFPEYTKKRDKYLKLNVSNKIVTCPIYNFAKSFNKSHLDSIIGLKEGMTSNQFEEMNHFETYYLDYLPSLLPESDRNLTIRFSEIKENYVALEILDERLNLGLYRFGMVLQIILYFDDVPIIKGHYMTGISYK